MADWIVMDGPEDHCFGCGQRNDHGLQLRFRRNADDTIETEYHAPRYFAGAPGVVHGGIQAALLDEVQGIAVHTEVGAARIVTAEFRLRYRHPVPAETPIIVRGRLVRKEEPSYFTEGQIVDDAGRVLTEAEARWRRMD